MNGLTHKVGRLTVASGLVVFGTALLVDNLAGNTGYTGWVMKLWPLLLIGFGVEHLIRGILASRSPDSERIRLRFDIGGVIMLMSVVLLSVGVNTIRTLASTLPGRLVFSGPGVSRNDAATAKLGSARGLEVSVDAGAIYLQRSTGDEVSVEATYTAHGLAFDTDRVRHDLEGIRLNLTPGNVITVKADIPTSLTNVGIKYTIYAPAGLTVKANTHAGSIYVTDYQGNLQLSSNAGRLQIDDGGGSLDARSSAGTITVRNFNGAVTARASVGSVDVDRVNGPLRLDSGTGTINIRQFRGGKVTAETRTGSIHAATDAMLEGDVILKTSAGSVNLDLPRESSLRVTANTKMGSMSAPPFMRVSQNGPARSGTGVSRDGKYTVSLETSTGSIRFGLR